MTFEEIFIYLAVPGLVVARGIFCCGIWDLKKFFLMWDPI